MKYYSKDEMPLLNDLFYSLIGVDSNLVRVRKGATVDIFFKASISQDALQIINTLLSIIAGVKECRYAIDEVYYMPGVIKQYLFKGIEDELEVFLAKVCNIRKKREFIDIQSLPFLLQDEIDMFSRISTMLKEIKDVGDLFLLEVAMKSRINCASITSHLMIPINTILTKLIEGKDTEGYFEERNTYDYSQSFWSSHYRIKNIPSYLKDHINLLTSLGKISKIRKTVGETEILYTGNVIYIHGNSIHLNEQNITAYQKMLCDCPILRDAWKSGITDIFGWIGLDVGKYCEMFKELGNRVFKEPTRKDISLINYLMKRGNPGYSSFEEHVNSPCLSFLDDSTFLLENIEEIQSPPVSFVYNDVTLVNTLIGICDAKGSTRINGLSLLQGLDISISLKEPISMFFSAKSVYELKILFRLIYSLYSVEYFLCSQYSHWRIRQILLGFVTGIRMFITEKIGQEFQKLAEEENILMYNHALENALSNITKASLLTSPFLIQFYSRVFSISFMYIEISERDKLTAEEIEEIILSLRECFRAAIPYVKSPLLILLFESLI